MAQLLTATGYPVEPDEVTHFYATSKQLVGYLLWKLPREKWNAFFARVLAGDTAESALLETYGWADVDALEKGFRPVQPLAGDTLSSTGQTHPNSAGTTAPLPCTVFINSDRLGAIFGLRIAIYSLFTGIQP